LLLFVSGLDLDSYKIILCVVRSKTGKSNRYYIFFPEKQDIGVHPVTQANYAGKLRVGFSWMKNKVVLVLNLS